MLGTLAMSPWLLRLRSGTRDKKISDTIGEPEPLGYAGMRPREGGDICYYCNNGQACLPLPRQKHKIWGNLSMMAWLCFATFLRLRKSFNINYRVAQVWQNPLFFAWMICSFFPGIDHFLVQKLKHFQRICEYALNLFLKGWAHQLSKQIRRRGYNYAKIH